MRMRLPSSPNLALAVGALGSGAANVAWTLEHGPVRVVAGLFATALVPIALHLWPLVPITGRVTRIVRALVMTYICLAAAVVNLSHSVLLLTHQPGKPSELTWLAGADGTAENIVLAALLVTAVEAVMVMATLARRAPVKKEASLEQRVALLMTLSQLANTRRPARVAASLKPRSRRDDVTSAPAVTASNPQVDVELEEPTVKPQLRAVPKPGSAAEWAVNNYPCTWEQVVEATGCGRATAFRAINTAKEASDAVA